MGFHSLKCFQLALFGVLFSANSVPATALPMAKPGCPDKCGNITIPFPFGVGDGCHLDDSTFNITCDHSYDPPKAYFNPNTEITEINIDGGISVLSHISRECNHSKLYYYWSNAKSFTFSNSRNKFTVIGCNSYGFLTGNRSDGKTNISYKAGCTTVCDHVYYNSCSGSGCCQIEIPEGLYFANVSTSIYNDTIKDVSAFSGCTYAFIVEEAKFKFSPKYLSLSEDVKLPVALDWSIDENTTAIAKACMGNATSYEAENVFGFRCKCKPGYEGNPYLGCHDIDECKGANNCTHECINIDGSYRCICPKWYEGDGSRYGKGCQRRFFPIIIIICCSTGLLVPSLAALVWWSFRTVKRKRKKKLKETFFKRNGGLLLEQQVYSGGDGVKMSVKLFTSEELERATDNYNKNRILGDGGQGTVYKGMLEDGKIAAIKKSKLINENQLGHFINEVVVLQQINHRNVVKLLGCCLETEVPMLVYEFIANGMLSHYLYDQDEDFFVTWDMRLRIAVEVADALSYLHSAASHPIYHCDIKSANILLDEKYRAKVADFGISRSIELDQTHLTIPNVQGTFGYLDPEYFQTSQFTDKSDVYSFGVVLIELMTGLKPVIFDRLGNPKSLANHFLLAMEEDRLIEIVDSRIVKESPKEAIMGVALLAKRCLNMAGKKRPTMREVAIELQKMRGTQEVSIKMQCEKELECKILQHWEFASTSSVTFGDSGPALSSDSEPITSNFI